MIALIGLLLLAAMAPAQSALNFGDVSVSVVAPPSGQPMFGYNDYSVSVTNRSKEKSHVVGLTLPRQSYGQRGNYLRSVRRIVEVAPGETARVSIYQSVWLAFAGSGLGVDIDGATQEMQLSVPMTSRPQNHYYGGPYRGHMSPAIHMGGPGSGMGGQFRVLTSRSVPPEFQRGLHGLFLPRGQIEPGLVVPPGFDPAPLPAPGTGRAPTPPGGVPLIKGEMIEEGGMFVEPFLARPEQPISGWSTSWLAYSSYNGVIVTADDLRKAAPEVRTALYRYTECGGCLFVLGEHTLPESWQRTKEDHRDLQSYQPGYGQCFVQRDAAKPANLELFFQSLNVTAAPWQHVRGMADANRVFPVVENIGIPVRGLFVLMIVFSLAIGPLNLMTLSRLKRRIWMLWTVPAISLVTCLAVFGYMLVSEGWAGHLRSETVTVLDEGTRRAATLGWTGMYAPMTPSDGLHFSPDTEVTAQIEYGYNYFDGSSGTGRTVNWTSDQHLAQGWISARIPAHFMVRKNENRNERITFSQHGATVKAVNGLGADVKDLWYADAAGKLYRGGPVVAGGEVTLTATGEVRGEPDSVRRTLFAGDWIATMRTLPNQGNRLLTANSYLAELDSTPFLEDPLARVKSRKGHSYVLGLLKESTREN